MKWPIRLILSLKEGELEDVEIDVHGVLVLWLQHSIPPEDTSLDILGIR